MHFYRRPEAKCNWASDAHHALGSPAGWKGYLDLEYPVKPADWDAELARIEAKLNEAGRMNSR